MDDHLLHAEPRPGEDEQPHATGKLHLSPEFPFEHPARSRREAVEFDQGQAEGEKNKGRQHGDTRAKRVETLHCS
jgi:hypothetical protein